MSIEILTSDTPLNRALELAEARGVLPTGLGTEQIRDQWTRDMRRNVVFSARTTNAVYLQKQRELINRMLRAYELDSDDGALRLELKNLLTQLGYTPETGFPGDDKLGIPPAKPGSLRDLSSDRRIQLILDTQRSLQAGAAQQQRGEERMETHPAWELIRVGERAQPRDWGRRFFEAGGEPVIINGVPRLIAAKGSDIWGELGSSGNFDDALDVDYPPFAFNSGMGWVERSVIWLQDNSVELDEEPKAVSSGTPGVPVPTALPEGIDSDIARGLQKVQKTGADADYLSLLDSLVKAGVNAALRFLTKPWTGGRHV